MAPYAVDTLLSTSQRIDNVLINSEVYYATLPDEVLHFMYDEPWHVSLCKKFAYKYTSQCEDCSPSDKPMKLTPILGLWSYRSFVVGNLAFLVAYRHIVAGPSLPQEACVHGLVVGGKWIWMPVTYKWSRDRYTFVLSNEGSTTPLFKVDITPFINNFDQLLQQVLKTVFQALANP